MPPPFVPPVIVMRKRMEDAEKRCSAWEKKCSELKRENEMLRIEMQSMDSRLKAMSARVAEATPSAPPPAAEVVTPSGPSLSAPAPAPILVLPPVQEGVMYPPPKFSINNENRERIFSAFPVFERLDTLLDIFDALAEHDAGRDVWNSLRAVHRDVRKNTFCGELFPLDGSVVDRFIESLQEDGKPFQYQCIPTYSTDPFWVPKQTILLIHGQKEEEKKEEAKPEPVAA